MAVKAFELYGEVSIRSDAAERGLDRLDRRAKQTKDSLGSFSKHKIDLDTRGAESSLSRLRSSMAQMRSEFREGFMSGLGLQRGNGLGAMAGGAAANLLTTGAQALVGGMKSLVESGIEYNSTLEQTNIAFNTLLGNQEKAKKLMGDLRGFAIQTPFESSQLFRITPQLLGAGVAQEQVIPTLKTIGNALSATGRMDAFPELMRQYTQMLSKVNVSAEEANSFAEAGINPYGIVGARMAARYGGSAGDFTASLRAAGDQGKLKSADFLPVFMEALANDPRFKDAMLIQSRSYAGIKSSKEDVKKELAAEGTRPLFEGIKRADQKQLENLQGLQGGQLTHKIGQIGGVVGYGYETLVENEFKSATGRDEIMSFFGSLADGSLKSKVTASVDNVVGTVADTIRGGTASVSAAASGLASTIHDTFTNFWEIQSPSRRAMRLGAWIKEGLEIGLTRGQATNYAKLQSLSQQDPEFVKSIVAGSARRGINPDDMLNLIAVESGFDKSVMNKFGYGGLGQVGRRERARLGLPAGDAAFKRLLENQSASWQVDNVLFPFLDMKLGENKGVTRDGVSLAELYAMWGSGHATGNPNAVHSARGGKRASMFRNNPAWNFNRDGMIQEWEFGAAAKNALGAGGAFTVAGVPVSPSNPLPVTMTHDEGGAVSWNRDLRGGVGRFSFGQFSQTIQDTVPVVVEVREALAELTTSAEGFITDITASLKPLQPLLEIGNSAVGDSAAMDRLKGLMGGGGKKERLSALSLSGVAGDFQGGLQNALMNPFSKSSWSGFGMGLLKDIQGRAAADVSGMLTGLLFGSEKDGKMSGGFLQSAGGFLKSIFGSLFGGGRASGGHVRSDRFYMVGEQGPELFAPGVSGHITPNHQLRAGGGRARNQRFIFVDSEREAEQYSQTDDEVFIQRFQRNRHILMPGQ